MGCCRPEKKLEENDIYSFFMKMEKEQHFKFSIENYESNYEMIIALSSNKFKKLKKKQQLRLSFANEILNNINKIYIDEKEDKVTKNILFNLLILTLTLENYLKEKESNSNNNNYNNDLQQFLLAIVIKILKKQFINPNNLKVVLYYIAKLLDLLFPHMENLNQYYNIEEYIDLIGGITDETEILHSKEIYPFIKVNLSCLGECFTSNYPNITLNKNSINLLINYYVHAYLFNRKYLIDNFKSFSKIFFFYNNTATSNNNNINNNNENNKNYFTSNNNNINSTTNYKSNGKSNINDNDNYNTVTKSNNIISNYKSSNNILKSYTTDLIYKKSSFNKKKRYSNNNVNLSNHSLDQSKIKNNMFKNSFISNMEKLPTNENRASYVDLFKSQEFKDIKNITISFYSFLNITIQDTLIGKNIFADFDEMIDTNINNLNEDNNEPNFKIDANLNKNIFIIIYFILFNKCKLENNTIIILSFLNFISDKIKQEKFKEQYHDILTQIYFLFNNDNIKQLIVSLLSKFFIKNIGNKNSIDSIVQLFKSNQSMFHSNKIRIFKHFLINIGNSFKENKEINLQIKLLNKLSDILRLYTQHFNKSDNDDFFQEIYSNENKIKYQLKKEELVSFFDNFELDEEIFHENNYNYFSYFIKYIKFHVNLLLFLSLNFTFIDVFKDFFDRKKIFEKLIYFITRLELFSLTEKGNQIPDIIILIQILLKIIKKNSVDCLDDFSILCSYMGNSLKKIIKEINYNYSCPTYRYIIKLSYSVIIFILIQLKKIFHFPNSIIKMHQTVVESVHKIDPKIGEYIKGIKCEFYNEAKLSIEVYQDFKNYLKEYDDIEIKFELFDKIINIIYDHLFGHASSLYMLLENQNSNLFKEEFSKSFERNVTKISQDNFDYISQMQMKFTDDKEEFSIRKKNDNQEFIHMPEIEDINSINDKESLSFDNEYSEHLKV